VSGTYRAFRSLSLRHIFSGHSKYSSNQAKYIRAHISRILYWWCLTGIRQKSHFFGKHYALMQADWLVTHLENSGIVQLEWNLFCSRVPEHCEPMQLLVKMSIIQCSRNHFKCSTQLLKQTLSAKWKYKWLFDWELQQLC